MRTHGHGYRSKTRESFLLIALLVAVFAGLTFRSVDAQVVSPLQGGHYSPTLMNIRDMAAPPPGLFVLWYNAMTSSDKFVDRNGNEYKGIRLSDIHPALADVRISAELDAFSSVPALYWASKTELPGGTHYLAGVSWPFVSADASVFTEVGGGIVDTTITTTSGGTVSGFSDLMVSPLGLSWSFDKVDATFLYGFYAPTGKYTLGSTDNVGLGFWTHQFQGFGYLYPAGGKATALMVGLTYELNGKIKDTDVTPGSRFTLEWGISQYFTEQFEVGVHGGHNWQVGDDSGNEVWWDRGVHDRKNTVAFNAAYWPWKERLMLNLKYGLDYSSRQRFENTTWMLNLVFLTDVLTGE